MKNSVFNIFRRTEIKFTENKGSTRKRRRISGAVSYSERQYRYADSIKSGARNTDSKADTAKEEFHFPKLKGFHFPTVPKKRLAFVAAVAVVAVAVPVLFAAAANSNGVAKIAEISLKPTASATPIKDDTSDLFTGVKEEPLEPATDGVLTSDLTESAPQGEAPAAGASTNTVAPVVDPAATTDPNAAAPTTSADPNAAASPDPNAAQFAAQAQPAPSESIYQTYTEGMEDPFISMIQQRLMDLDYMEPDETTYKFGPITAEAIGYFQRKNGLPVDNIAGPATQEKLFSNEALYYTVSEGASGLDVESIQERLEELGYNVSATGYFGTETTAAVKSFQSRNDLTDDGNVGSGTREVLYSSDAKAAPKGKKTSSGSSSNKGPDSDPIPAANPGSVEAFIAAAEAQLGDPYVRGGKGPDSFDCSGLVYYALKASGNGIGYMTSGGWASSGYARIDSMSDLQRGDVICVSGHVAIYLGGGQVVHASSSNGAVVYGNIGSSYWSNNWICGRRPL
jgi:peptidoglycan hydrolase-like protein with peptidoglycan-binding domain